MIRFVRPIRYSKFGKALACQVLPRVGDTAWVTPSKLRAPVQSFESRVIWFGRHMASDG